jgi:hypothetical protein
MSSLVSPRFHGLSSGEECAGGGEYGGNLRYSCVNGEMRPVETVLRIGGEGIKEDDGGANSTMTYCKHFCKHHNVLPKQRYDYKTIFFKNV